MQYLPWVSYNDSNNESQASGFWFAVHRHKQSEREREKQYSLTYQEAEIVTSELVQLFIMGWPHRRSDGSASCETYTHTGICDPSAHSESWGPFIK